MAEVLRLPRKLVEVALPLDDVSTAAVREKSIHHGHPSSLHLWWSRKPLAAARAVLFAQLVDDPGDPLAFPGRERDEVERERARLFDILRGLVPWENTNDAEVLARARDEIVASWQRTCDLNPGAGFDPTMPPEFLDPFCGGGSIPLEAQRLGLASTGLDLNPVAVLLTSALVDAPRRFLGRAPVGPAEGRICEEWAGAAGLSEDVRRYGRWMREQALERIGAAYPRVEVPGGDGEVVAWIWCRSVPSPSPALRDVKVPLSAKFVISERGGEAAWVEPVMEDGRFRFVIRTGGEVPEAARHGTKASHGANFRCLLSGAAITPDYVRAEAEAGRLGRILLAVVAQGGAGRRHVVASEGVEQDDGAVPSFVPSAPLPDDSRAFPVIRYGFRTFGDLFSPRQLLALSTFADLVGEARARVERDALEADWPGDGLRLAEGGTGAAAYADAVATYLAFAVDRASDYWSTVASWNHATRSVRNTFTRQAIPIMWDFVEVNPFGPGSGSWMGFVEKGVAPSLGCVAVNGGTGGARQHDAALREGMPSGVVVSTDPPYFDNIGFADLSDYFYVWLRRSLRDVYPDLFMPVAVPKDEELVAAPHRHGGKKGAEVFYVQHMAAALRNMADVAHPAYPLTIYFAFKQSTAGGGSAGWETFLQAVVDAGLVITGTWPLRTELATRMRSIGSNALASSVVLACRRRAANAPMVGRREFLDELKAAMPSALAAMLGGGTAPLAPIDLAQAAIGPGMAVFTKYSRVIEADGSTLGVAEALRQINRMVDEHLHETDVELDGATRFALDWYATRGCAEGPFGEADVAARGRGAAVDALVRQGLVVAERGRVRLRTVDEHLEGDLAASTVWVGLHQIMARLGRDGETGAGEALGRLDLGRGAMLHLAYRLYGLAESRGWVDEALAYNCVISSWQRLLHVAATTGGAGVQGTLGLKRERAGT